MKVLVVLGHQRPGSFCHAIAETAVNELKALGHEVVFHDLYQENFDPILTNDEIASPANPEPKVPDEIQRHCRELVESDGYVIVHPNWWGQMPAILKGWIDRVLRQGVAYAFTEQGVDGKLKDKRALVLTTSNTPRDIELKVFGDPLENLWKTCIFGFCGVENFKRRNFESIVLSTPEQRQGWLEDTKTLVREMFGD
ncbi:MAG: flavodoxin family protein [Planctomycetota bacterium]|nr:MAG: flavodoxin family protein [Planctomycetota bacterium]